MDAKPGVRELIIVDDDPFQIKLLSTMLSAAGFSDVRGFVEGHKALNHMSTQDMRDALLFLDLGMPEMDGIEFVRNLVEQDFHGSLVLVSGEEARILESAARLALVHNLNVMGSIQKPVQRDTLATVLDQWSKKETAAPPKPRKTYGPDEVSRAISNNELTNFYQPKLRLHDGAFAGVETLVRWNHPDDGLVFPDQFIGVAEEHGLIESLTRAVLTQALRQASTWHKEGLKLTTAVNVSMENLSDLNFPNFVQSEMALHGISSEALVLEVTESRLMTNPKKSLDVLTRLRLKQINLSIDDFGTGHSSLAQLRDLPFNELKIDRSFVHGVRGNPGQRAIVEANLTMARELGMSVVGEGVEDKDDWDYLRAHGCDYAQGYFMAKPMPAALIGDWRADWEKRRSELAP